jgi:GNAT superfamily N-acetyltransferase
MSGDNAIVRELEAGDLGALLALYGDLHENDQPASRERVEAVWETIAADTAQVYLGVFLGGELVAACNAAIIPNLTRGCRPYAVIENVVTAASHRRRGFGAAVLEEAVARCWARDCYKVMLMSASGREAAHEFYEAIGFDRHSKQAFIIKREQT